MKFRLLAIVSGLFLAVGAAYAGPTPPTGNDSDSDGVEDEFDNCKSLSNASQTDTDHNGCGDSCTQTINCDFNGDKRVLATDFFTLRTNFGMTGVPPGTLGDCAPAGTPDGNVLAADFFLLRGQFGHAVGPSGISTPQCKTASCICTPQ